MSLKLISTILGIPKTATRDEIRKAYRKLALTNHPDKVAPEEREAAETRFKAIQQAYEILHDDEKRKLYDTHGMDAFTGRGAGGADGDGSMEDILAQMFGMGGGAGRGSRRPKKSPNEMQPYPVSLEELYTGKTAKFTITKDVLCSLCNGRGGKEGAEPKECTTCKGKGVRTALRRVGQFLTEEVVPCQTCHGDGKIFDSKDVCKKCKGAKVQPERKTLELYIPPGSSDGDRIVMQGEADQAPGQEPGDVIFVLEEKEHPVFKRQGADLSTHLRITLAESLCGFSRVILKTLDGRGLTMNHEKPQGGVLKPLQVVKVVGEGMPVKKSDRKGDLYLITEIAFPEDDCLQDERVTAQLKELLPPPEKPIEAEETDDVTYDANASIEGFGTTGESDSSAWEDMDGRGPRAAECAQQ